MANFDNIDFKINLAGDAYQAFNSLKILYQQGKHAQDLIARYQTDQAFKTAVDFLFTPAEIQQMGQMLQDVDALVTSWETTYTGTFG